jgi:hypothetical protein
MALLLSLVQVPVAQFIGRAKVSKGPRAIGLVQILPNGKARLIPIAIMVNGRFYDAGAYKAAPVPVALEQGTVYEAQKAGVSAGLFTVTLVGQTKDAWVAEGSWLPAGAKPTRTALRAETKPIMGDENDAPPTLRHGPPKGTALPPTTPPQSGNTPVTGPSTGSTSSAPTPSPTSATTPTNAPPSGTQTSNTQKDSPSGSSEVSTSSSGSSSTAENSDANSGPHPMLRRGSKGNATQADKIPVTSSSSGVGKSVKGSNSGTAIAVPPADSGKPASTVDASIKIYPAISDANGPELRPFAYEAKPDEEARFRKTMLDLAADEVRARAKLISGSQQVPEPPRPKTTTHKAPPKGPQPNFDNVQLRIFDMSNSNEPTLVLSATAHMPPSATGNTTASNVEYFVTVVGRWDINGDMHKIFARTTDSTHLDSVSRVELIDAIDADGDNRGDLLFRQISDADTSYVIYRVSPDKLWPLFNSGAPED